MGKRLDRIAAGLIRPINPFSTIIGGVFTCAWGLWLIMPFTQVFDSARLFDGMSALGAESAWGSVALLAGMSIIIAVNQGYYRLLQSTLGSCAIYWFIVTALMFLGDWNNTGGITYLFTAIWFGYFYLNIKINYVKHGEDIPNFYT